MKKTISNISFIVHENHSQVSHSNICCSVSGGQDSILLVLILVHLQHSSYFYLQLFYCNHFWQKQNFFCTHHIFKLGYLIHRPTSFVLPITALKTEEQARSWRQKNFQFLTQSYKCSSVALGHTISDQVETSFWHFLRGTSPTGIISLKKLDLLISNNLQTHSILNSYSKSQRKLIKFVNTKTSGFTNQRDFNKNNLYKQTLKNISTLNWKLTKVKTKKYSIFHIKNKKYKLKISFFVQNISTYFYNFEQKAVIYTYRPLLDLSRTRLQEIHLNNAIPVIQDTTNKSLVLGRNKIRLILIPLIQYYIQRNYNFSLQNYNTIVSIQQNFFNQLFTSLINFYCLHPLDLKSFHLLPLAIKQLLVKKILTSYTKQNIVLTHILYFLD